MSARSVQAEPLIQRAAQALAIGASKGDVRALLLREGCTEENAYLLYVAAKLHLRAQGGRGFTSHARMVSYRSTGAPMCRARGHAWQAGPVKRGVAQWRCVQCGSLAGSAVGVSV